MKLKVALLVVWLASTVSAQNRNGDANVVGVVVGYLPYSSGSYLGSPCLLLLPNGDYVASYDWNSHKRSIPLWDRTVIMKSTDKGRSWVEVAKLLTQHWSSLFYANDAIYIVGPTKKNGDLAIQKSQDGGYTWTSANNEHTGLLAQGEYHSAPTPVIINEGRLWKAVERRNESGKRCALIISAPLNSNLLLQKSWTFSNCLDYNPNWLAGTNGWIEGNAVVNTDASVSILMRVQATNYAEIHSKAAKITVSPDGKHLSFDPGNDFIDMPGATSKKFTVRFDSVTGKYYSLVNRIRDAELKFLKIKGLNAGDIRNTISLISSEDLRTWKLEKDVLSIPYELDTALRRFSKKGIQYPDWQFEGTDIIYLLRTSAEDGLGGGLDYHDANYITFHRLKNFR
ncbi:MAG: sialidase family protein [Bacteroidota bacterium]